MKENCRKNGQITESRQTLVTGPIEFDRAGRRHSYEQTNTNLHLLKYDIETGTIIGNREAKDTLVYEWEWWEGESVARGMMEGGNVTIQER